MKYMGSKRWMLGNGLGHVLLDRAPKYRRFVDLFSGTGAVAGYVASQVEIPVLAVDLQTYSAVLAGASIGRTEGYPSDRLVKGWIDPVMRQLDQMPEYKDALGMADTFLDSAGVFQAREWCAD